MSLALTSTTATARSRKAIQIEVPFKAEEVEWAKKGGTASVSGSALLRTVGGDIKTCAAQRVSLTPVSAYATAIASITFQDESKDGFAEVTAIPNFADFDPAYIETIRVEHCDAQGNFLFEDVAPGSYYLTAEVTWGIPHGYMTFPEGGALFAPVTVKDGEKKRVMLSR
jgi:hypothetical protein